MQEADNARGIPALIADLGIWEIWQPQTEALFDIRVVDTDALPYVKRTVEAVLQTAEQEKKKFLEAVQTRCETFSPFVVSVDGVLGREAINSVTFSCHSWFAPGDMSLHVCSQHMFIYQSCDRHLPKSML